MTFQSEANRNSTEFSANLVSITIEKFSILIIKWKFLRLKINSEALAHCGGVCACMHILRFEYFVKQEFAHTTWQCRVDTKSLSELSLISSTISVNSIPDGRCANFFACGKLKAFAVIEIIRPWNKIVRAIGISVNGCDRRVDGCARF